MSEGDIWFSLGVFWSWLLGRGIQLADCSFEKDRALVMADFLLASKEYYAELNAHKVRQRVYDDEEKEKLRIRGRLNQLRHLFD